MARGSDQRKGRRHPGAGRKRGRARPKGRQVDPEALAEVRSLLGDAPRRRDLLLEFLHAIQDAHGGLAPAHLAALAEEMRLALAEVYEVATFYAHFDVLEDGAAPPPLTLRVCESLSCALRGGEALCASLSESLGDRARVVRAPCMGRCHTAPVVEVGHHHVDHATPESVVRCVDEGRTAPVLPAHQPLDAYRAEGGYALLASCRAGEREVEELLAILGEAGLQGMGGAGFPAGEKCRIVRREPAPRYVVINADEGEPGTFKDRFVLETEPHRFFEGMLLAAWAVEAAAAFIYLRDEYPAAREILLREIAALEQAKLVEPGFVQLRRGAGAYICGEESAMLESIEGKRGLPRHRPPYAAQVGLFGRPTLVNNVETVYWIRDIVEKGAAWFSGQGRRGSKGVRAFSVSGRVRRPGVAIAPAGVTARELIDEFCGGMEEGHRLKGYLPGGASGGILPASLADLPLDFGSLDEYGCFVGSGAVVVLSDRDDVRGVALNLLRFFEDESCGQCTPCRVGTEKAVALMQRPTWDEALLDDLCHVMGNASICGLGHAAGNPIQCAFAHFRDDVEAGGTA